VADANYDLVVIGAGPGGYVAAIRAAQLGLRVACIEREPALGGTCLRVGCIPSKALLESSLRYWETEHALAAHGVRVGQVQLDLATMLDRKNKVVSLLTQGIDGLFKKNKIERVLGTASFAEPGAVSVASGGQQQTLTAQHIIIATGSRPATLPGVELDGDRIGTSTEALLFPEVPAHLIVIGGGYIGLELGSVWRRLGAKVTVLEYLDHILPGIDRQLGDEALRAFKKQGIEFHLGCRVTSARAKKNHCIVESEGNEPLKADRVLLAVGRQPNTEGLGLQNVGIETDRRGFIPVDAHYRTKVPGIYALGDVIGGAMLAHKAEDEGVACVEGIVTGYGHVNYNAIPAVVFTHPEIASVGNTEEQLKEAGIDFKKGVFPFRANSRARTLADTDGFVKILADAKTDRVLGVHIIGPHAGDLIAEATAAIEFGASSEDLARTCHAHPTLSEAVKEAALGVAGRIINA
jgi:dihydrolipoamide dehydrogenase